MLMLSVWLYLSLSLSMSRHTHTDTQASIWSIWTSLTPTTSAPFPLSLSLSLLLPATWQLLNKILQLKLQKFCLHLCMPVCVCPARVCVKNGQIATNMAHINYDKMALMSSAHTSAALPVCARVSVCVCGAFVCESWRVFQQQRNICAECFEWLFRRTQKWPTMATTRIVCIVMPLHAARLASNEFE